MVLVVSWRYAPVLTAVFLTGLLPTSLALGGSTNQPSTLVPSEFTQVRPYLIAADPAQVDVIPLLTSGDVIGDYQMAGVPDGLGAYRAGDDVVLFMSHELTPQDETNLTAAR